MGHDQASGEYFLRLNPAWESTLGYTRDELKAKSSFDFVNPDHVAGYPEGHDHEDVGIIARVAGGNGSPLRKRWVKYWSKFPASPGGAREHTRNATFGCDFFRPWRGSGGVGGRFSHGSRRGLPPFARYAGWRDTAHFPAASPALSARDSTIPAGYAFANRGKTALPAQHHSPRSGRKMVAHCASGG